MIRDFAVLGERAPDREIEEARFFPRSSLPEGTTAGTRARLAEIFEFGPDPAQLVASRWRRLPNKRRNFNSIVQLGTIDRGNKSLGEAWG